MNNLENMNKKEIETYIILENIELKKFKKIIL